MSPDATKTQSGSGKWRLYYDEECGLCRGAVRWLSRADLLGRIDWVPYQSLDGPPQDLSWSDLDRSAYLDTDRGLYEGFHAFRRLALRLPPLLPLALVAWLPGMSFVGVAVYRWVARNRHRLSGCRGPVQAGGREASPSHRAADLGPGARPEP